MTDEKFPDSQGVNGSHSFADIRKQLCIFLSMRFKIVPRSVIISENSLLKIIRCISNLFLVVQTLLLGCEPSLVWRVLVRRAPL